MNLDDARIALVEALRVEGFSVRPTWCGMDFHGKIKVRGALVDVILRFDDFSMMRAPRVIVPTLEQLSRPVVPHLNSFGELCVYERTSFLFDPYNAAGYSLGILAKAAEDLERNIGARAEAEISQELPQHFSEQTIGVSFGQYEGPLIVQAAAHNNLIIRKIDGYAKADGYAVTTKASLSFRDTEHRPTTWGEFLGWLTSWDSDASARLVAGLRRCVRRGPDLFAFVCAENGSIGVRLRLDNIAPAQRQVFERIGWTRLLGLGQSRALTVNRMSGRRCDLEYVLSRNGGDMGPLSGKRVMLVGCGSIGGYASLALAQMGAGAHDGEFVLVDKDILEASNVARHILGMGEIKLAKVSACKKLIDTNLPGLKVTPRKSDISAQLGTLSSFDLVIDATGEHEVGELLNRWRLDHFEKDGQPTLLAHGWIEGQGAAVRSFINHAPENGCYRCLQADLLGEQRYRVLKPDADIQPARPCGEAPYTPYGPAVSMAAAALLVRHVTEYVNEGSAKHLLTQQIDHDVTFYVKPASPARIKACPACG